MPIQEENIVFVESQVMDDVPEGGGAATGSVVEDGLLNNVFEDISDLDRAYGRLNLRKLFLAVRSLDTDLYGGAKLAVTALPNDPALGYTLFTTKNAFDTRADAQEAVEQYLYKGPMWHGALLDNHIAGMQAIRVLQRVDTQLPPIGKTLCLVANEGDPNETEQYIRVIDVNAVETTWGDGNDAITRWVVTLDLSGELRYDFDGHQPNKDDVYVYNTGRARLRDTTVADATRYYASQRLAVAGAVGDTRVRAASMFGQLVPSSQTEDPLVNQVMAGSVSVEVDAGNGHMVSIQQSAQTLRRFVTVENRRRNWIETLQPPPAPGTLSVSFFAQGNWYLLSDNGEGILAGDDASIGAGTLDYTTNTVLVTLGALPDAGSQLLWVWGTRVHYTQRLTGDVSEPVWSYSPEEPTPMEPGSVLITWLAGEAEQTLSDDGANILEGDGYGVVDYATGRLWFKPSVLPDPSTTPVLEYQTRTTHTETFTPTADGNGLVSVTLEHTPIKPKSVSLRWETVRQQTQTERANQSAGQVGYLSTKTEFSGSGAKNWTEVVEG